LVVMAEYQILAEIDKQKRPEVSLQPFIYFDAVEAGLSGGQISDVDFEAWAHA
jgi:hypothetical protein